MPPAMKPPLPEPVTDPRFPGIHAVLYALFDAEEHLDRVAMRQQVEACVAAGVDGIVVLGLATEVAKLTEAERREVIGWAVEDIADRVPLGVTVYGNSVTEQLDALARRRGRRRGLADPAAALGRRLSGERADAAVRPARRCRHAAHRHPERPGADGPGPRRRRTLSPWSGRTPGSPISRARCPWCSSARSSRPAARISSCSTGRPAWR